MAVEQWARRRRRNRWLNFWIRLLRHKPLAATGFVIVVVLLVIAGFANFVAPFDYREQNYDETLEAWSVRHLMGTDQLGRDVFSRVVWGARVSVIVSFSSVVAFLVVAIVFGMVSGYIGGKVDLVIQRIVDAWMVIPTLILLLALISVLGQGIWQLILVLSVERGIVMSRVLRGEALSLRETMYVEAARAIGAGAGRILFVHLLPNAFAAIVILATISLGQFILAEASLSFLGFGIPPPFPTWGGMLSGAGLSYMQRAPWMAIWPGVALTLTVWAFNMFGDGLRDLLDPRLRGTGRG